MSLDHLKLDLNASLIESAERTAYEAIRTRGAALPCTIKTPMGPLVEVSFNVIGIYTIPSLVVPVFGVSQYIRQPFRAGDMGVVFPLAVSIASVTGQGSGGADLTKPVGPMSALTFFPGGNSNWSEEDPDALVLYSTPDCKVSITPAGVTISGPTGNLDVEQNLAGGNGLTVSVPTGTGQILTFQGGVLTGVG